MRSDFADDLFQFAAVTADKNSIDNCILCDWQVQEVTDMQVYAGSTVQTCVCPDDVFAFIPALRKPGYSGGVLAACFDRNRAGTGADIPEGTAVMQFQQA